MFCFYTNIKVIMKKVKAYWNRENAKSTEFECLGAEMIYRCSSFSHATTKCLERYESWESFHVNGTCYCLYCDVHVINQRRTCSESDSYEVIILQN